MNILADSKPTLYLVGCFPPTWHSIGDHAQTVAVQKYLSENFSDYSLVKLYRNEAHKLFNFDIKPDDLIFISSSGDFGDLYPEWHSFRKKIIQHFNKNKVVQLPVSIYYNSPANFEQDKIFFSNRSNLLLLCRSKSKTQLLRDNFSNCNIQYCPDFVYTFPVLQNNKVRKGVLLVLRKDHESNMPKKYGCFVKKKYVAAFLNKISKVCGKDLHSVFNILAFNRDYHLYVEKIKRYYPGCVVKDVQVSSIDLTDENRESEIMKVMNYYSTFELVVTDRFHAGVFSVLTGTPYVYVGAKIAGKSCIYIGDVAQHFKSLRSKVFSTNYLVQAVESPKSDVLELIRNRRSIRKWLDSPIEQGAINVIIESGVFAPSAANYQGVKFLSLTQNLVIQQICNYTSPWFKHNCPPCVIIVLYDVEKKHTIPLNFKSWHHRFIWQDSACAIMNMMLAAESLELKTCWASVNPEQAVKIKALIRIAPRYVVTSMLFVGYGDQVVNVETAMHQGALIKRDLTSALLVG